MRNGIKGRNLNLKACEGRFLFIFAVVIGFSPQLFAGNLSSTEVFVDLSQAPLPFDGGLRQMQLALTFDDGPDQSLKNGARGGT